MGLAKNHPALQWRGWDSVWAMAEAMPLITTRHCLGTTGTGAVGGGWSHQPVSTSQLNQYHLRSNGVRWEELKGPGVGGGKKQPSTELGKCCSAALPVPPSLAPAGLIKALSMHHDAVRHTTREARWRRWSQLKERRE